jgi:hypothetical protein
MSPVTRYLDDSKKVLTLVPLDRSTPLAPKNVTLSLNADGKSVRVSNINVSNATSYVVQYRRNQSADPWTDTPVVTAVPGAAVETDVVFPNYWESYLVRVKAINIYAAVTDGPWSNEFVVNTNSPENNYNLILTWADESRIQPLWEYWYNVSEALQVNCSYILPATTTSYDMELKIDYAVNYWRAGGWNPPFVWKYAGRVVETYQYFNIPYSSVSNFKPLRMTLTNLFDSDWPDGGHQSRDDVKITVVIFCRNRLGQTISYSIPAITMPDAWRWW